MDYKTKLSRIAGNNAPLPDKINDLFAHFEQKVGGIMSPALTVLCVPVPMVTIVDVRLVFLRVKPL